MTEFEYIRSLNDQELAEYILTACILFASGTLSDLGIELPYMDDIPSDMVDGLVKVLQEPHREPQR